MNYTRIRKLGVGGFGEVWLARQEETGALVAIKYLKADDSEAYSRFCREARIYWQHRSDSHVARLLDYNLECEHPFIVLEFAQLGTLRGWCQKRRLSMLKLPPPWRRIARVLRHAAKGLRGVHEAGGFHRDIKPDNLLVFRDDAGRIVVKVSDFGLGRHPIPGGSFMTFGRGGTNGYIAPEVIAGAPFDAAADIYSLGVTAVELLTGSREPAALGRVAIPAGLREIVGGMLNGDPFSRPDARTVSVLLKRLLAAEPPDLLRQAAEAPTEASTFWENVITTALIVGVGVAMLKGG